VGLKFFGQLDANKHLLFFAHNFLDRGKRLEQSVRWLIKNRGNARFSSDYESLLTFWLSFRKVTQKLKRLCWEATCW
jgi:hypothetical protein